MPRKSALDDRYTRNRILSAIRAGQTIQDAAEAAGTTERSVHRYATKYPAFYTELTAARATGTRTEMIDAVDLEAATGGDPVPADPPPSTREYRPPSKEATEFAEAIDIGEDLIADAEFELPQVPAELEGDASNELVKVPPLTPHNVLMWHWRCMNDKSEAAGVRSTSSQILAKVIFDPMLEAKRLRAARELKAALEAEQESTASQGSGVVFVEIPRNGSEAPGRGPQPRAPAESIVDAELV